MGPSISHKTLAHRCGRSRAQDFAPGVAVDKNIFRKRARPQQLAPIASCCGWSRRSDNEPNNNSANASK
jgi:hypothetical protein